MLDYIRGCLQSAAPGRVVIEVGGIGLLVQSPVSTRGLEHKTGEEVTLYTRLIIKEDEVSLYGFSNPQERDLFNQVLSVSGFGPRLALALLSTLDATQLYHAVMEENTALLCRAPGVGRKVAGRLILELKEKLPKMMVSLSEGQVPGESVSLHAEVIEALCALGYSQAEALSAVNKAIREHGGCAKEDLLKASLKGMAGS